MRTITLVVKVTDQCNLHCPYCYYYAGDNASLRTRKFRDAYERMEDLAKAIISSKNIQDVDYINITLHGGEPLLANPDHLQNFINIVLNNLENKVTFSLQTNGVLVNDEWINFFIKNQILVGVSIDAVEKYHNERRPDSKGQGSFNQALNGLRKLQNSEYSSIMGEPGVISVYDERVTAEEYFSHVTDIFKTNAYDVLFPDEVLADKSLYPSAIKEFNNLIKDLWYLYNDYDNPQIQLRFFKHIFDTLPYRYKEFNPDSVETESYFISLDLKGGAFYDDSLTYAMSNEELSIGDWRINSLDDILDKALEKVRSLQTLSNECRQCEHLSYCQGGPISARYNPFSEKFDKYIFCDSAKFMYEEALVSVIEKLDAMAKNSVKVV